MFQSADDVRRYMTAGKAVVTVTSKATGASYTYKVAQAKNRASRFFVSVLTGPNNTSDFTYVGTWDEGDSLRLTKASRFTCDAPAYKAAAFTIEMVCRKGMLPKAMEIRHEGKCGRCARALTVPESIDRGIGPECWANMVGA